MFISVQFHAQSKRTEPYVEENAPHMVNLKYVELVCLLMGPIYVTWCMVCGVGMSELDCFAAMVDFSHLECSTNLIDEM